ncbi:MAG: 2Fe-2S iron-sulfur cluster-binding protein [Phycisphaerae bacterium]
MVKVIIDGQDVHSREGNTVLQAALDSGWDIPHYCYHPGLSVVASCRLCLMEMKMPNPKTHEMDWSPKLVPACQTLVREGLEVRFTAERVAQNQKNCMEFFLLNHPLDCPVCDQAGECYLQDYSYRFGRAESRMVEDKLQNPKKDIGPRTLLYSDRCVLCNRCVRFTNEISGTHELCVVNRGSLNEIDVFPGRPLDNPLQGNVVDLCPVGALLDKDFLFKRRVWELSATPSICPGCATGCAIRVEHCDNTIYRLKPRYDPGVNDWWICDAGRFGYKHVHAPTRITAPAVRRGVEMTKPKWEELPAIVRFRLEDHVRRDGGASVAAILSPFMACEEAWLLARFVREMAPDAVLASGPVPMEGQDQRFPPGASGDSVKFTIAKEKCPNRRGVELVLDAAGGVRLSFDELVERATSGAVKACWIGGGYPGKWLDDKAAQFADKIELLIVHDMFESALTRKASVLLPACAWAEREGSFVNGKGILRTFERAIKAPNGAHHDGQYLYEIAGFTGIYRGAAVRELMAATIPLFAEMPDVAREPAHAP